MIMPAASQASSRHGQVSNPMQIHLRSSHKRYAVRVAHKSMQVSRLLPPRVPNRRPTGQEWLDASLKFSLTMQEPNAVRLV